MRSLFPRSNLFFIAAALFSYSADSFISHNLKNKRSSPSFRHTGLNWAIPDVHSIEVLFHGVLDHALLQTTGLLADSQAGLSDLATKFEGSIATDVQMLEGAATNTLNSDLVKDLELMDATETTIIELAETGGETSSLIPLGNDLLIFLMATIVIVPAFKVLKASPVVGFLAAGLLLGPAGLV